MSDVGQPKPFPTRALAQIASRITDGSHFSPTPQMQGHLIANVKDMKSGRIDFDSCTRISTLAFRELKATGCVIKKGNVLLSKDGTVGRVVVYESEQEIGALSSICLITPQVEQHPRFLGHALQSHDCVRQYENAMSGSALRRLVLRDIRQIRVPTPAVDEQATVAEILDTLDTTIRQTEAIIEKLKQVKQGLLHDLLTRGIDANGELRPPQGQASHLYKDSPLGWIPREWAPHALGEVLLGGTRNGLYKPSSFHGSGPLMVQMGGMFRGEAVDFQSATRVRVTRPELNAFGLQVGDLLFARRSLTFEGAGQCAIVRDLPEAATFESSIVRARVDRARVEPEFAALFLRGALSSAHRRTLIRQVAVSGVSSEDIAHFLIALPQPAEQAAIIRAIASVQNRIERETVESHKLSLQKSGLMDDLLTGRVRVTPLLNASP